MQLHKIFTAGTICISFVAVSQTSLPVPRNIKSTYTKETRTTTGAPGKNYWQNAADYTLDISFDPQTRLIRGNETVDYINNSPDTLRQIFLKLYPNYYKKGSPRASRVSPDDLGDGLLIDSIWVNDKSTDRSRINTDATNAVIGRQSLPPGQHLKLSIAYHYTLNKGSHMRTGEIEPGADFIAYFFPRIAVYDDIDGWNSYQYLGSQEFYNDFCNFNVTIRVPDNYLVWATGDLVNCNEVLNDPYCEAIGKAEKKDAIVTIVDTSDLRQKNITRHNAVNNWKFIASNVTDFVFAVSDHYIWQSSSLVVDPATKRRTRVDAVFNTKHKDYFNVLSDARKTVEAMSYIFPAWPFPYAHETVFDGLDQMEYPMMVNDNPVQDRAESIELTDHEIFHTMFPFYMGINETKYAWMDEGWATLGEWLISPIIDSALVDEYGVGGYENTAGKEIDAPIISLSTQLTNGYFVNSYPKPAMGYLYIKDMLGDSLFNLALHHYIEQWHGKHPMPLDFFNCMNTGAKKNLNWFWKKWFYDDGMPDLSIVNVGKSASGYTIKVNCTGSKPVPVDLDIAFADGTTTKIHKSIAVWEKANSLNIIVPAKKAIIKITLGSTYTPDINKKDNSWEKK